MTWQEVAVDDVGVVYIPTWTTKKKISLVCAERNGD